METGKWRWQRLSITERVWPLAGLGCEVGNSHVDYRPRRLEGLFAFYIIITKSPHPAAFFLFSLSSLSFGLAPSSCLSPPLDLKCFRFPPSILSHLIMTLAASVFSRCSRLPSSGGRFCPVHLALLPLVTFASLWIQNLPRPHEKSRTFELELFVWTCPMCNYDGSFVLVTWVVSRCAVWLIIDVGAHRLGAWQGLLAWSLGWKKPNKWSYAKQYVCVCISVCVSLLKVRCFFGCHRDYVQSLRVEESISSPSLLYPHFPICHRSGLFQPSPLVLSSLCLHWPFGPVCLSRTEGETLWPRGSILGDLKLFSPQQRLVLSESTVAIQFRCHPGFYRALLWRSH